MGRGAVWKLSLVLTLGLWGGSWLGSQESWAASAVSGRLTPEMAALPSIWGQIIKVFGILGVLLGLLLLSLHLARKPLRLKSKLGSSRLIHILATHYLETKKALILVEVAGQRLLLASAADNLILLTSLPSNSQALTHHPGTESKSTFASRDPKSRFLSFEGPQCTFVPPEKALF